jgi:type IV secretion system protein TrbB
MVMRPPAAAHLDETQERRSLATLEQEAASLIRYAALPDVEDIVVNSDGQLWINWQGNGFKHETIFPSLKSRLILTEIAAIRRLPFSYKEPVLETDFLDGSRITGIMAPLVRGTVLAIRPIPKRALNEDDYIDSGIATDKNDALNKLHDEDTFLDTIRTMNHMEIIQEAIQREKTILVVGGPGSGKTTLINMMIGMMAKRCPEDRIVAIQDTLELYLDPLKNHVSLLSTHNISMAKCLKTSLRLAPNRIIVGEVRSREAETLLNAWNTGQRGGLATVHANNAVLGLQRLEELLPGRPRDNRAIIARAINLVVFIDKEKSLRAGRKLRDILVVLGYDPKTDR